MPVQGRTGTACPAGIVIRRIWVQDFSEVIAESDLATGLEGARRTGARLGLLPVCSRSQTGTHELSDKLGLSTEMTDRANRRARSAPLTRNKTLTDL